MSTLKRYNTGTSAWETAVVNPIDGLTLQRSVTSGTTIDITGAPPLVFAVVVGGGGGGVSG